ncbi:MAG: UDP-N-acetylmuramate dehydrogenase [Pseudonocardiaceae bacterium]
MVPGTPFASLTTLRLGGIARCVLRITEPTDWRDIVKAVDVYNKGNKGTGPLMLGHGSNVIAADAGHPGPIVVMSTRGIAAQSVDENTINVTAQAGEPLTDLVQWAASERLAGLECLAGIPGTVGAAPVQNVGAYGQQIADILDHVTAWDWKTNRLRTLAVKACRLGYRRSRFKATASRWTILTTTFHLTRSKFAAPVTYRHLAEELGVSVGTCAPTSEVVAAVLANRQRRGLLLDQHVPDARQIGSVFLNPPVAAVEADHWAAKGCPVHTDTRGRQRVSAGWLLEYSGYRPGQRIIEGVHCSSRRTLTLVVCDNATSTGFVAALNKLTTHIRSACGVDLSVEPTRVGAWPPVGRRRIGEINGRGRVRRGC